MVYSTHLAKNEGTAIRKAVEHFEQKGITPKRVEIVSKTEDLEISQNSYVVEVTPNSWDKKI